MSWVQTIMTVAVGVALGYFLIQFILKNGKEADSEDSGTSRRLHKSLTNKQVAGVCGGLAEYLNVDPTVIRLATVLLIFGWGSGLLAYIICALVMPAE